MDGHLSFILQTFINLTRLMETQHGQVRFTAKLRSYFIWQQNYKIVSWNHKNESSKNSDGTYVFEHSKPQLWDTIYDYVDGKYSKISKKGKRTVEENSIDKALSVLIDDI